MSKSGVGSEGSGDPAPDARGARETLGAETGAETYLARFLPPGRRKLAKHAAQVPCAGDIEWGAGARRPDSIGVLAGGFVGARRREGVRDGCGWGWKRLVCGRQPGPGTGGLALEAAGTGGLALEAAEMGGLAFGVAVMRALRVMENLGSRSGALCGRRGC